MYRDLILMNHSRFSHHAFLKPFLHVAVCPGGVRPNIWFEPREPKEPEVVANDILYTFINVKSYAIQVKLFFEG